MTPFLITRCFARGIGMTTGVWLVVFFAATTPLTASTRDAYLPLTGPTQLRFEAIAPQTFTLSPVKIPEAKPAHGEPPTAVETTSPPTNAAPEITVVAPPEMIANPLPAEPPLASIGESLAPKPVAASPPAGDMLVITPQMLAEFFKPVPGATNAAGVSVFVPVPLGFTPPTDRNPPSSRATYKTE